MFSMAGAALFLPFLPMLPTQILLNNLLYDVAQLTIPTDHVDPEYIARPQRWDISVIRRFMLRMGPVSSIFVFLTFAALLFVFHFGASRFQTGWFVESLATQVLVVFVIRTVGRPWSNPPSVPLAVTAIAVVIVGIALPYTPLAKEFGMSPLPPAYLAFVALVVPAYLVLVELLKGSILRRALPPPPAAA
jgi:Mg2+-importing ATPase